MTKADLLELIANGENSGVEFKRDDVRPEQLAKEIVALANLQGGKLLIGVEDDGRISGIQSANLEMWIIDTVFGHYVHPMILPFYEEVDMGDGRRVAVVTIAPGTAKPYVLRRNGREDIYVRVGSVSKHASREQQLALFGRSGLLHTGGTARFWNELCRLGRGPAHRLPLYYRWRRSTPSLTGSVGDAFIGIRTNDRSRRQPSALHYRWIGPVWPSTATCFATRGDTLDVLCCARNGLPSAR